MFQTSHLLPASRHDFCCLQASSWALRLQAGGFPGAAACRLVWGLGAKHPRLPDYASLDLSPVVSASLLGQFCLQDVDEFAQPVRRCMMKHAKEIEEVTYLVGGAVHAEGTRDR